MNVKTAAGEFPCSDMHIYRLNGDLTLRAVRLTPRTLPHKRGDAGSDFTGAEKNVGDGEHQKRPSRSALIPEEVVPANAIRINTDAEHKDRP
jgi:hypothetical protein